MKAIKESDGSYRVRKMYKGQRFEVRFDHNPTQKEMILAIADVMENVEAKSNKASFDSCAQKYISSKSNILSPSTIGGYEKVLRQISDEFKNKNIYDLTQLDIQEEVNRYSVGRKPKTVANFHGFISAVFSLFRPNMNISTSLPQKAKYESYLPTEDDIKTILKQSEGSDYHVMFQLGVLGLRRSEACCISPDDIDGNMLTINKALVYDKNNKLVIKNMTKTTEGMRTIYVPDALVKEISKYGKFKKLPANLVLELHRIQDQNNIPHFRFHDLRHYFASYAHAHGMSEADIMASGGWQSDYTMKRIYRHSMEKEKQENQKKLAALIFDTKKSSKKSSKS